MTDAWAASLDELERSLRVQRAALDAGRFDEIVAFRPPTALGPLPPHLAARAVELRSEAEQLCAALSSAAAHRAQDLRLVAAFAAQASTTAGASFIDTHG